MTAVPSDIAEAAAALRAGRTTSVELLEHALAVADRLDPALGVYLARFDDQARAAARAADEIRGSGVDLGPLHGIPLAVKDMLTSVEGPATAQSAVPDSAAIATDADAVAALRRAGAVITGKTTLMEFSKGYPDPDAPFPFPRNPWSLDHWAGGSSSGTAAGIGAGLFFGGLGSDSGGSIRIPAAFTGTCGHKPTFDLVPRGGLLPLSDSLDHVGPMGRSAYDCAVILEAIASGGAIHAARTLRTRLDGRTVRIDTAMGRDETSSDVATAFTAACEVFAELGAHIVDAPVPRYSELIEASSVIAAVEARATHSARLAAGAPYRPRTVATLEHGAGLTDDDRRRALRTVDEIRTVLSHELGDGVLVTPTAPTTALSIDAVRAGTETLSPTFTRTWNAVGFPATSIPMGFDRDGLPIGLQIVAPTGRDELCLGVGCAFQRRTRWHRIDPPLRRRRQHR
ncbi:glutamyl-tRNA(gln) amidotransferase subunit A [Nocardia nova SH22a]|uniref:Glutamyl-tRNA(Gln) amidotransferase subunit A n=1 Tax=Nocardia nova SH22a TaxID=1415166 RepID=W5TE18_9NOCA|nr:amidase [Nocardia nova]AHH17467.1 glutamyl-tRNA(gln) amidotransferase subunit A [Nocardia nova SH22a]